MRPVDVERLAFFAEGEFVGTKRRIDAGEQQACVAIVRMRCDADGASEFDRAIDQFGEVFRRDGMEDAKLGDLPFELVVLPFGDDIPIGVFDAEAVNVHEKVGDRQPAVAQAARDEQLADALRQEGLRDQRFDDGPLLCGGQSNEWIVRGLARDLRSLLVTFGLFLGKLLLTAGFVLRHGVLRSRNEMSSSLALVF